MSWAAAMLAALRLTLGQPRWWALALASFLVRGGVVAVLLPVVAIPTVAGLQTFLQPLVTPIVLGGSSTGTIALIVLIAIGITAVVLVTGAIGAFLDVELLAESQGGVRRRGWQASVAVRFLPHVLTAAAIVFASARLVDAAYGELTSPGDTSAPLLIRIFGDAPQGVILVVLMWTLAEAIGGAALRTYAAAASSIPGGRPAASDPTPIRALWSGLGRVLDATGLATLVMTDVAVVALAIPLWLAAGRTWEVLRILLFDGGSPQELGLGLAMFVVSWMGGLLVLGAALAWRATAWTFEWRRHEAPAASD